MIEIIFWDAQSDNTAIRMTLIVCIRITQANLHHLCSWRYQVCMREEWLKPCSQKRIYKGYWSLEVLGRTLLSTEAILKDNEGNALLRGMLNRLTWVICQPICTLLLPSTRACLQVTRLVPSQIHLENHNCHDSFYCKTILYS